MSLNLVTLPSAVDKSGMLGVLDKLRESIEAGEVVMFSAVAIDEGDECLVYQASDRRVTLLRQIGAVSHLLHCIQTGEV